MKNLLFPPAFHILGWILFIPALIAGLLIYADALRPAGILETVINDAVIIGIALGSLLIVCSKEKTEDEMTRAIRLSALLNSLYIYILLLILSTIMINGVEFMEFAIVNLVLFPIIYVLIFRLEMHRYSKITGDEEPDQSRKG